MKKFNYSKCLLWVFVVGSILSCTRDTVITKVEVTFNYNYEDAPSVAPQTANIGSKINTPKTPTRSGYAIKAWNSKADGTGSTFNFETTTITANITLYAQWLYYPLNKSELQDLLFTQNVDPTKIDTGRITDMSDLFKGKTTFNKDISGWDTSEVTTMQFMFESTRAFNGDISGWNTSSVTTMAYMFYDAKAFNGNISGWNTSSVTTMSGIFSQASIFKQDLSTWDTSSVTNFQGMFTSSPMASAPCYWPVAFRPSGTSCP